MSVRSQLLCVMSVAGAMGTIDVSADEWATVGSRQLGMGGAGVATTRGGLSTYWNPAALAAPRQEAGPLGDWDVSIPFTLNVAAPGDVLSDIDDLAEVVDGLDFDDIETRLDDGALQLTEEQLRDLLDIASRIDDLGGGGRGVVGQTNVGVAGRIGYFGISALAMASAGGVTTVDLNALSLGDEGLTGAIGAGNDRSGELSPEGQSLADDLVAQGLAAQNQAEEVVFQAEQAGLPVGDPSVAQDIQDVLEATQNNVGGDAADFLSQNGSGIQVSGLFLQEYGASFAYPFFEVVSIGVTAKLMHGTTFQKPFRVSTIEDGENTVEDLFDQENTEDSLNFGIDVGVLVQPTDWLSLGVVARNINRPSFDFDGHGDYTVDPQIRAGVGVTVADTGLTLAVDVDIIENESETLIGYDSQVISAGLEYELLSALYLRGGVSKNFADSDENLVVHGGLGLYLPGFSLDVAGSAATEFVDVDGRNVPERGGLGLFIGINVPLR